MRDSPAASALRRAIRYTVGTAIVALIVSALLPETDAERLATVAYLAVIFAAVTVAALHFVSAGVSPEAKRPLVITLPTSLQSVVVVTIVLLAAAALAGQPGAEAFIFMVCAGLTAVTALWGAGLFRALHAELAAGGLPAALTRYAVLVGIVALLLGTMVPAEVRTIVMEGGFAAVVAAVVFLSTSLMGRTAFGRVVLAGFKGSPTFVFERMIRYAAYASAGALLLAGLWPQGGDTFAFAGYVAIVFATVGMAIETRLSLVAESRRAASTTDPR